MLNLYYLVSHTVLSAIVILYVGEQNDVDLNCIYINNHKTINMYTNIGIH